MQVGETGNDYKIDCQKLKCICNNRRTKRQVNITHYTLFTFKPLCFWIGEFEKNWKSRHILLRQHFSISTNHKPFHGVMCPISSAFFGHEQKVKFIQGVSKKLKMKSKKNLNNALRDYVEPLWTLSGAQKSGSTLHMKWNFFLHVNIIDLIIYTGCPKINFAVGVLITEETIFLQFLQSKFH